jgi:hypothetical protein
VTAYADVDSVHARNVVEIASDDAAVAFEKVVAGIEQEPDCGKHPQTVEMKIAANYYVENSLEKAAAFAVLVVFVVAAVDACFETFLWHQHIWPTVPR